MLWPFMLAMAASGQAALVKHARLESGMEGKIAKKFVRQEMCGVEDQAIDMQPQAAAFDYSIFVFSK
ncbi:uncharacterized protein MYCFIDRAFT_171435 [Pseudocercospora fijiensis CIRAD86]|uniref:Uncharacterized protein n=1 Tax=Pseudocercospora fijiensis (strain CIRAD86) TaxID=383855 RepID=M3B871_PSEFD|nr:uncharacterized protein MYCFIDRAFT_171435 [Pseudocercospora fijiensis CIRAD86]EME85513.1 hypothetical protein MYCFIDRAFT_171435 [Pseudocercospora fijiensis CIRAD86]